MKKALIATLALGLFFAAPLYDSQAHASAASCNLKDIENRGNELLDKNLKDVTKMLFTGKVTVGKYGKYLIGTVKKGTDFVEDVTDCMYK